MEADVEGGEEGDQPDDIDQLDDTEALEGDQNRRLPSFVEDGPVAERVANGDESLGSQGDYCKDGGEGKQRDRCAWGMAFLGRRGN